MSYRVQDMLYLGDLYFTDSSGNYRLQWTNRAWVDQVVHPGEVEDDNEYYQQLAKYEYLSDHLNDGSGNAYSYRVNVYDKDTNQIVHTQVTSNFNVSVDLDCGEYLWEVEALNSSGQLITRSEKSYINTYFTNWSNAMSDVGDGIVYFGDNFQSNSGSSIRWSAAGGVAGESRPLECFVVCGPGHCGNETAWEIPQQDGYTFSVSNAFGGFDGEFALAGNCLVTCGGIYEYENGSWNYKLFTDPWMSIYEDGDAGYMFTDGESDGNKIFRWDAASDSMVTVLTAANEIYYISDYYYVTCNGVFSIANNSQILSYDVRYGECPVFNDMFLNIYAKDQSGNKCDELENGETGSIEVSYFFFDKVNSRTVEKKMTLFSGTAPVVMDAEEILEGRIGNCITYVISDECEDDDDRSPQTFVFIHEIKEDGSITEYKFTCTTSDGEVDFSIDENELVCTYIDQNGMHNTRTFSQITLNFNELFSGATAPSPVVPTLQGNANGVTITAAAGVNDFIVEYSQNNFASVINFETDTNKVDTYLIGAGSWQVRAKEDNAAAFNAQTAFTAAAPAGGAMQIISDSDEDMDIFFARTAGTWSSRYAARHAGSVNGWQGTGEKVALNGKNIITDVFSGSSDDNILLLTDDANGDALFLDDVYTALGNRARLSRIEDIRAGAGDDVIDLTSPKYTCYGSEMSIYGGAGNDVIWATGHDNDLYGDGGNDRIIGGAGFDLIIGGAGNDSMNNGGGDDIFAFGGSFGQDTVEIVGNANITLWFASGSSSNWNAVNRIYRDGSNSVTVSGSGNVSLKFGDDGSDMYDDMVDVGAFLNAASEKIFENVNSGMLA